MAIIDKIQISGTNYDIKDASATTVVNVTQAEYDDLVTGGTLDPSVLYNITDATPVDISQYWTSAQTSSAITEATSGKVDTSVYTAYTAATDTALDNKVETSAITTAVTTASTDSEIPTAKAVNDAIEAGGGGGGKAIEAGRGIDITTGATADTISIGLPISAGTGTNSLVLGYYNSGDSYWNSQASGQGSLACGIRCTASNYYSIAVGYNNNAIGGNGSLAQGYMTLASGNRSHSEGLSTSATSDASHAEGYETTASGNYSHAEGWNTTANGQGSHAEGKKTQALNNYAHSEGNVTSGIGEFSHSEGWGTKANDDYTHAEGRETSAMTAGAHTEGYGTKALNYYEHAQGWYNVSNTGSTDADKTLFSVGNGTANNARHNAFEIRKNGDIYISSGGTDIKLQDNLGGGTVDQTVISGSTNAVAGGAVYDQMGGMKILHLTQAQYDALSPDYDNTTLYVITNS